MLAESASPFAFLSRDRVVVVHTDGNRRFFGRSSAERGRELSVEEVEALVSAGFDIVEVKVGDGTPLCAALASPVAMWPRIHRLDWLDQPRPARRTA
jgi:hypothetical protein